MANSQPNNNAGKCPWDQVPLTVEAAIKSLQKVSSWEKKHGPAPDNWKVILSVDFMLDLLYRFETLEEHVWEDPISEPNEDFGLFADGRNGSYRDQDDWAISTF
jgi:hypothetical protein